MQTLHVTINWHLEAKGASLWIDCGPRSLYHPARLMVVLPITEKLSSGIY